MKKRFLLIATIFIFNNEALIAQQIPTGTAPPNPLGNSLPQVRDNTQRAWYRGGNQNVGTGGNNNIFGTLWNSPIYTQTFGINRTKLNGNVNYPINGVLPPAATGRNGFMLIGQSNNLMNSSNQNIYNAFGAFSLLHLNGAGTEVQQFGHRVWMHTGVTFTGNRDLSYFGLRKIGADCLVLK
jgi:hypothetical protein